VKRKSKIIVTIIIALHVVVGFYGCKLIFIDPPEYFERASINKPYDAIIVPGVPFENGAWSSVMKGRVLWSWYLYKNGFAKNVIYSGSSVYTPFVEGKIMAMYAEKLGIPKENIFSETHAEHSTENVYYGYKLGQHLGFKSMALATDPFQTKTLLSYIKKLKISMPVIPMVYERMDSLKYDEPVIDTMQAYVTPFTSITEREGFWKRLRGTMGKRIKYDRSDI
jgi:uncharacterized SAM-binding protein YcdF (DUF218 family)